MPLGANLNDSSMQTKTPHPGALALDVGTNRMYYGLNNSVWQILDNGNGDVIGPNSSVNNTLATFNGTTGKIIQDNNNITAIGGQLNGVTGINGIPVASFGNVFGESLSTVNHIVTYQNVNGTGIQDNTTVSLTGGQFVGVTGINGIPIGSFGDVHAKSLSTANHITTYFDVSGTGIQDSTTVSLTGGQFVGVTGINGTAISNFVVGPGSSTVGHVAVFNNGTGNLIADSGVTISGTNTGDVTLAAFGSSPNADGASLSGQQLTLQPASVSQPGGVSTGTQQFLGQKDFSTSGIQLIPSANAGIASTKFGDQSISPSSGYAYQSIAIPFAYNVFTGNLNCIFEIIGNRVFLTITNALYSATQYANTFVSTTPIPVPFRPANLEFISGVDIVVSFFSNYAVATNVGGQTSEGIIQIDSSGNITIGYGFAINGGTGAITGIKAFPNTGASGFGSGVYPGSYSYSLV